MSLQLLSSLSARADQTFLIAETETIVGFLIASPVSLPPVYDAGPTAIIDDFWLANDASCQEVGAPLAKEAKLRLSYLAVHQLVVVTPYRNEAKLSFLKSERLSLVHAWFAGKLPEPS